MTPLPQRKPPFYAASPSLAKGWRLFFWILATTVLGIATTALTLHSHRRRTEAKLTASLPVLPDLAQKSAVFAQLLTQAQAQAKAESSRPQGVMALGRLYHANNYVREAEACWRWLAAEQPTNAKWEYYLADLRRAASDYPAVDFLLKRVVELDPDYAPAWLQRGNLEFKAGKFAEAADCYQRRLTLIPRDPYARLGLARIAEERGQRNEARALLEELVRTSPNFSPGHNLYAEILDAAGDAAGASHQRFFGRETGRFRDADDPWLDELQDACYDFNRLCILATIDQQTTHGDQGKARLERAIRLSPENPTGYELLGRLNLKLGNPAGARAILEQGFLLASRAKPTPMMYVDLARAYRELKQPGEAVRICRLGLARIGDQFELYDALGVALAELNQSAEAIAAFQAAIARNPNDPSANLNLAVSLLMIGKGDDAYAALKRSLILQPTFPRALLLLGRMELEAGRWENARQYLEPLYESHPEMTEARGLLAEWHLRAGTTAEATNEIASAEKHYRDGLLLDGGKPELNARLGTLLLIHDRVAEAREPLEAYHHLRPNEPQSALFLGQVYWRLGQVEDAKRILTEGLRVAEKEGKAETIGHFREMLEQL